MTLDALLSVALDVAYLAILAVTVADWIRHRGAVRRAVVLLFLVSAFVLLSPIVRLLAPSLSPLTSVVTVPALISLPLLTLRLVSYIHPIPRALLITVAALCAALSGGFLWLVAQGVATRSDTFAVYAVGLLAYYVAVSGAATSGFVRAARARAGASRSRLRMAAAATALLATAIVVLLAGGLANPAGSPGSANVSFLGRTIALLAAIGYLAAFAPPRALRRLSQQGVVYGFIRDLNAIPSGVPIQRIWDLLVETVRRTSGASSVQVLEAGAGSPRDQGALRTVEIPFTSQRWPDGRLVLALPRHALFAEDDLEAAVLLVDRAVRAAEREALLVDRERLIADLQAASAAKSDFVAAMSHELRTPLNAIIGFSELLAEGGEDASDPTTVARYAEHIHGSGLHLLDLVNDVLDLARVEAGRIDLRHSSFDLDELVRQTADALQPLADGKRQRIVLELSSVTIDADRPRIRQVVLNLLSNAIKFTGEGGEIRISLDVGPSGAVRLRVADTGRGIAPADLDLVFEAFQQGAAHQSADHRDGTGLGLALTRELVEAHGGTISVRSEVGAGSEFTVQLPAGPSLSMENATHPPALDGDRPWVLVIEDDPAALTLLRRHLEGAGYAVLATASGSQGLAWMREVRPDAVLLDILLPDLDGWEILQRAKSDPATRSIPIMVVSVLDDRELGVGLGAVDYFVKPVSREGLLEALGRLTFTTKVQSRTVTALVIDGDPAEVTRYRELLEPDGFRVIDAGGAASGRRRAILEQPELILLDVLLPDGDGFELVHALRSDPATATIPIWLTTPAGLAPEAKTRLNGTVQGVLARGDDALSALHAWLASSGGARGRAGASGASEASA